jgi:hypothetical protein
VFHGNKPNDRSSEWMERIQLCELKPSEITLGISVDGIGYQYSYQSMGYIKKSLFSQ